tara:strand:+ start:551 stop:1192 length:642 start_codon:yes stop_codon:yes gene_type:complete
MTDEQNLIKEVNEEVRQDNYKRIWNKYKKYIISLIVIVLVIVSAININNYSKEKKINKQSELFFQALDNIEKKNYAEAYKILLDINQSQVSGFSDLSSFYILDLINKEHVPLNFEDLKINKKSFFYGLIILQKFNNQINFEIENINNINEIIDLSKPSSIWKFFAHELLASYYIKKNDTNSALQSINTILSSDEPSELMKERAKTLKETIERK